MPLVSTENRWSARWRRQRESDYARQLRAKQKARRVYGVLERQFRRYFGIAQRRRGLTGLNLLQTLELRLDNVVYRMGLAENRAQARQMVTHGHFLVNGIRTDIPSMILKPGDIVDGARKFRNRRPFSRNCRIFPKNAIVRSGWIGICQVSVWAGFPPAGTRQKSTAI